MIEYICKVLVVSRFSFAITIQVQNVDWDSFWHFYINVRFLRDLLFQLSICFRHSQTFLQLKVKDITRLLPLVSTRNRHVNWNWIKLFYLSQFIFKQRNLESCMFCRMKGVSMIKQIFLFFCFLFFVYDIFQTLHRNQKIVGTYWNEQANRGVTSCGSLPLEIGGWWVSKILTASFLLNLFLT